ncbi:MAG TPA: M1 family metallopeptidase, partial [Candidatus Binataceae bacterium]|nr:M1 family metallopeptidase [Candidatus Binataceae bacterium]
MMHKPRFLDQVALELGDRYAFASRFANGRRPFQPEHVEPKWPRDRVADIRHIKIEIALDFDSKSISGTATHRVGAIVDGVQRLEFDAAEMTIATVRAGGTTVGSDHDDGRLKVNLARALKAGDEIEIAIDYSARPRRGLYFVGPDDAYPDKPIQAWTQGEDEDSRYWFPCYDYPNDRATSEVIATVPEKFTAISNGDLVEVKVDAKRGVRIFHYRHDVAHSAYLITLAAGEFAEIRDNAGNVPVLYYVQPGREGDARRAFGNTPRMIEFFARRIGVPYPYARYTQVAVADFIFGGMENTSATTQTADTLHDQRAHIDFSSDPLVAHELAHQWWGDLLTCRDWAHAWLNEGFATYFEAVWAEADLGWDEYQRAIFECVARYLDEDEERYRRPIVCNVYRDPVEL